jgi:hypothetical protein
LSYGVVTVHNTPKGRASLREGDRLVIASLSSAASRHSGKLVRIDEDAYVLDDDGVTIIFPFDRVHYMMREKRH